MPVIVRTAGGGGGSSKGYPCKNITDFEIIQKTSNSISIKFSDPDDTVVDDIVFAKWAKTVLVKNSERVPESAKDGSVVIENTEKNKYQNEYFEDTQVEPNKTYYYRFFTYTDNNVENNKLVFKKIVFLYAPSFQDATWENIHDLIQSGSASKMFSIGDTKTVRMNPCMDMKGGEVTFMIAGFDIPRISPSNDYGKAVKYIPEGEHNICLVMKKYSENMKTEEMWVQGINTSNSVFFYYEDSGNKRISDSLSSEIPNDYLLDCVEATSQQVGIITSKFNLLTAWELGLSDYEVNSNNKAFPVFTDNESRKFGKEFWTLCAKYDSGHNGYPSGKKESYESGDYNRYPKTCKETGTLGNSSHRYSNPNYIGDYVRVKCFLG